MPPTDDDDCSLYRVTVLETVKRVYNVYAHNTEEAESYATGGFEVESTEDLEIINTDILFTEVSK